MLRITYVYKGPFTKEEADCEYRASRRAWYAAGGYKHLRRYHAAHPGYAQMLANRWKIAHPEEARCYNLRYKKTKYRVDPSFKLRTLLSSRQVRYYVEKRSSRQLRS